MSSFVCSSDEEENVQSSLGMLMRASGQAPKAKPKKNPSATTRQRGPVGEVMSFIS